VEGKEPPQGTRGSGGAAHNSLHVGTCGTRTCELDLLAGACWSDDDTVDDGATGSEETKDHDGMALVKVRLPEVDKSNFEKTKSKNLKK
jgi:hypothetical protein